MINYKKNAFFYASIVAMGGFVFGLDAALISGTVNFISQEFGLTDLQLGTTVAAPALGVIVALPFAGYAANILGRKRTLQIIAALYLISALGSAFAQSYWMLVSARFLGGLAFSSITLSAMYIGEIAPSKWRGKLVSMNQINIVVGLSAAYFINYLILQLLNSDAAWVTNFDLKENVWRWMLGSEIIPALLWFALLFFIPRSPYWLLLKNKTEEAKATLRTVIPENEINPKVEEMSTSLVNSAQDRSLGSQLNDIFGKPMRVIFIVATTIAIAQQSTGINAIMFYAPTVIEQLGLGTDAAFQQAIWFGLVSLVFTIISLLLIDKMGRRPMILWGMVWIIASLAVCSYGFKQARYTISQASLVELTDLPNADRLTPILNREFESDTAFKQALRESLGEDDARDFAAVLLQKAASMNGILILIGILSFIAAFHFSVGPIMWVLFSEIFPISIRGIAIPFFALITSVTSYLVQKFFPWQLNTMGSSAIFLFYAVTVAIGLVILYRYLPETKNMSIEEIQESMSSSKT